MNCRHPLATSLASPSRSGDVEVVEVDGKGGSKI